jgi:peptide-methionine (S)-S-oxide reductase
MSQSIIFGGGCFWCVEAIFKMLKGIESVTSGYTGGNFPNPTYEDICTGKTGHAEVIKIEYKPDIINLETLLTVFFTSHDPTTPNQQGNDLGPQYRSAIFFTVPEQKRVIENYIQKLTDEKLFTQPIITQVLPLEKFYPAEGYHQNYYSNNQDQPYCQIVIDPKIIKFKKSFSHLLKD